MTKQAKKTTTTATSTVKASKKSKQTLGEFRAWLSGVEEMQPEDWAPDLTQWKRIRARIDEIVEGRPFKSDAAGASDEDEQPVRQLRMAAPSGFGGQPMQMMPQPMQPTPPPFMNTSGEAGARISTPNVDTSDGRYASSLE